MPSVLASVTLSAAQLYTTAIHAMENLPQPSYVTYHMLGTSDGTQVDLWKQRGSVWLNIHKGSGSSDWTLRHRTYDYASEIVTDDQTRWVTARSFFDPTWYGTYRALHEGMLFTQDPAPPRAKD